MYMYDLNLRDLDDASACVLHVQVRSHVWLRPNGSYWEVADFTAPRTSESASSKLIRETSWHDGCLFILIVKCLEDAFESASASSMVAAEYMNHGQLWAWPTKWWLFSISLGLRRVPCKKTHTHVNILMSVGLDRPSTH